MTEPLPVRLRKGRKAKKLSQILVGEKVGVSQSFISAVERGDKPISRELLEKLAHLYGLNFQELLESALALETLDNRDEIALLSAWRTKDLTSLTRLVKQHFATGI